MTWHRLDSTEHPAPMSDIEFDMLVRFAVGVMHVDAAGNVTWIPWDKIMASPDALPPPPKDEG